MERHRPPPDDDATEAEKTPLLPSTTPTRYNAVPRPVPEARDDGLDDPTLTAEERDALRQALRESDETTTASCSTGHAVALDEFRHEWRAVLALRKHAFDPF